MAKKIVYCVLVKGWIMQDNLCNECDLCNERLERIKKILEEDKKKGEAKDHE